MRAYLSRRGYRAAEAARTVERLAELGYLDDVEYAAAFVTGRAASRGWGPGRVRKELARRGIGSEIIQTALERARGQGLAPSANIDRAVAKHLRLHGKPGDRRARERLRAALLRQGFAPDAIRQATSFHDDEEAEEEL